MAKGQKYSIQTQWYSLRRKFSAERLEYLLADLTLSDLELDLLMSLKVKYDGAAEHDFL